MLSCARRAVAVHIVVVCCVAAICGAVESQTLASVPNKAGFLSSMSLDQLISASSNTTAGGGKLLGLLGANISTVDCAAASKVLSKCPIGPRTMAKAAVALANPTTVSICCAAAKSFNDLGCAADSAGAGKLHMMMGSSLPCASANNAWKVISNMCGFESNVSFCPRLGSTPETGVSVTGRHLLYGGDGEQCFPGSNFCFGNQCCSAWDYCGTSSRHCGDGCKASCGGCFPASAIVQTPTGTRRMDKLRVGDAVAVVKADGSVGYEEVFFMSHQNAAKRTVNVALTTSTGKIVRATPDHLVYIKAAKQHWKSAQLTDMASVKVGDDLWTVAGQGITLDKVVQVDHEMRDGVYHPHTASGNIIVDDVAASCYTKHIQVLSPAFGNALFTPFRMMYRILGADLMAVVNDRILSFGIADSPLMAKAVTAMALVKQRSA